MTSQQSTKEQTATHTLGPWTGWIRPLKSGKFALYVKRPDGSTYLHNANFKTCVGAERAAHRYGIQLAKAEGRQP